MYTIMPTDKQMHRYKILLLLQPFYSPLSRTTWVSLYQKDKPLWMKQRWWGGSGISWTICKSSAPHSRQITTPAPHRPMLTWCLNYFFNPSPPFSVEPVPKFPHESLKIFGLRQRCKLPEWGLSQSPSQLDPLSGTIWASQYQKDKPFCILLKQRWWGGSGISWTIGKLSALHSRR